MISSDGNNINENYENNNSENIKVHLTCLPVPQSTNNSDQSHIPKFEVPLINVNVYVPPNQGNIVTLYLPKIQPIIHLHFDEIAKVLKLGEEENKEAAYQIFQSLLSMTSPKLGDVKYQFFNDSVKEKIDMVKTRSCSSENCSVDENSNTAPKTSLNVSKQSEIVDIECNKFNMFGSNTPKNTVGERKITPEKSKSKTLEECLKLKKAVVVLKDICKSKYYKNLIAAAKLNDSTSRDKDKETQKVLETVGNVDVTENICSTNQEHERCLKMETESSTCESQRENCIIVDTYSLVNTTCSQAGRVGNNDGNECEVSDVNKALTALAEGCNFSEILKRFKLKQGVGVVNLNRGSENPAVTGVCIKEEITCNDANVDKPDDDVSAVTEDLIEETNCLDESYNMDIKPSLQESAIELTCNEEEFDNIPDCDKPLQSNDSCHLNSSSDSDNGNDVTPEEESSLSDIRVTDSSEIYYMSPTNSPFLLPINKFIFHKNNSVDSLPLKIIEERMKGRSESKTAKQTLKNKLPKRGSPSSEASSLPKKMKYLNEEGKTKRKTTKQRKTQSSSGLEGYIPLKASGPTKFAVAPLNKVTPYKTHEAKNFKSNMLFGNRVTRFSNSNILQTYLMKKNAYKNQAS